MFENKVIFGGIYRAKDLKQTWSHTSHPDLHLNDQRYNIWIPITFSGNKYVDPGIYMIDTYQVPRFSNQYPFEKLVEHMISYGENGDTAYYECGNYYYNSRIRLTDDNFNEFELIADLRDWRAAKFEETCRYSESDVLRRIKLYREHCYPYGICLIKKDAQINRWNQVEDLCDTVVNSLNRPSVGYKAYCAIEELRKIQSNENVNIERVRAVIELYEQLKQLETRYNEVYDRLNANLTTTRYEWLNEETNDIDVNKGDYYVNA